MKVVVVVVVMAGLAASLPVDHDKSIKDQVKDLKEMGCQPVLKKVRVADLLHSADDLVDMLTFYPQVVAVRQCVEDCSFCGTNHGVIHGRCVATGSHDKTIVVAYYDNSTPTKKLHRKLTVVEHTQCGCSR